MTYMFIKTTKKFSRFNCNGFTLIELLIVISVIGVMAGVMLTVLNPQHQRDIAEDGVKTSTLEKLASGIEAYNVAEGSYPVDKNSDGNPMNDGDADDSIVGVYIQNWPEVADGSGNFIYVKTDSGSSSSFCVSVPLSSDSTKFLKYVSPSSASCSGKIVTSCTTSCRNSTSIEDCSIIGGVSCTSGGGGGGGGGTCKPACSPNEECRGSNCVPIGNQ